MATRAPRKPRRPKVDPKWIRTKADREAIKQGCWFDEEEAARVCEFFETFLKQSKGKWAGLPFKLEDWQRDWLSMAYGWKTAEGFRRYRECYLEVPKKNGKSTLISGLCLHGIFEEPGAEVYTGAVDRSQASIVFDEAAKMARASKALNRHLKVMDSKKRIVCPGNNAKFEAMSSDVPSKDGLNASLCVLDELHRYKNEDMYEVMEHAGAARDQPLRIIITTAGINRHSICYRLHEQARRIIEGDDLDITFYGVIYAADPEKDDLDDPATWRKANPSMGSIIKESDFAMEYAKAKKLPRKLLNFLRLRLNIWTEQSTRWLSLSRWDALKLVLEPGDLEGLPCYAALDLSSVADLASLTLCFPDGDRAHIVNYFFVPEETAEERAEADKVPYPGWGEAGHLILTPGNALDHDSVLELVAELAERHEIKAIGLDPWNAQHVANKLVEAGHDVAFIRQGYASLSGPSKALERMILAGRLSHEGNPVQRWCVGNAVVEQDAAGNIKPSKRKSSERIDGVVSMVMALGLAIDGEGEGEPSITVVNSE